MLVACKRGNSACTWIALSASKGWYNVTSPQNNSGVYDPESLLIFQRPKMNAAQSAHVPCMTSHGFVPPNEKKVYPTRFMHVCRAYDVNVMYANDFGITIVISILAINAIVIEQHNIAVRSPRIDDILSPADIVSGIVKPSEIVMINPVAFEVNGVVLFGGIFHGRFSGFRSKATNYMFFQSREKVLNNISE